MGILDSILAPNKEEKAEEKSEKKDEKKTEEDPVKNLTTGQTEERPKGKPIIQYGEAFQKTYLQKK